MKVDIAYNIMGKWYITTMNTGVMTNAIAGQITFNGDIYLTSTAFEVVNLTQKSYIKNRVSTDIGIGFWKRLLIRFVAKRYPLDEIKKIARREFYL